MKKAIKINLGGLIFHIDEDAYDCLKNYLSILSQHFGNGSESKEIIDDVESRMAELFQEKISNSKQVINLEDVENVIAVLGKPSDFDTDQTTNPEPKVENKTYTNQKTKKRFYRDTDNSVLGGVGSGMGAYFNTDPVIFRILFVALTFAGFAAVPIYIILWIALPAAKTAAQKLEMRGEDVNVSNIGKTVQDEYSQDKGDDKNRNRAHDFFEEVLQAIKSVFKVFLKIFGVIFGVLLTVIGIIIIVALIIASTHHDCSYVNSNIHIFNFPFLMNQFITPGTTSLLLFLLGIIVLIPIIGVLYLGLKLIFGFRLSDRYFWLSAIAAWIIAVVFFVVFAANGLKGFSEESSHRSTVKLQPFVSNTLYLKADEQKFDNVDKSQLLKVEDNQEYFISNEKKILGTPKIRIVRASDNETSVEIEKSANGSSSEEANSNIRKIEYSTLQKDSLLSIDPYFEIGLNSKWRAQSVELIIKVPEGKSIYIDRNLLPMLDEVDNDEDFEFSEMVGKILVMRKNGLEEIKKD